MEPWRFAGYSPNCSRRDIRSCAHLGRTTRRKLVSQSSAKQSFSKGAPTRPPVWMINCLFPPSHFFVVNLLPRSAHRLPARIISEKADLLPLARGQVRNDDELSPPAPAFWFLRLVCTSHTKSRALLCTEFSFLAGVGATITSAGYIIHREVMTKKIEQRQGVALSRCQWRDRVDYALIENLWYSTVI
jgi:hypothetical protein